MLLYKILSNFILGKHSGGRLDQTSLRRCPDPGVVRTPSGKSVVRTPSGPNPAAIWLVVKAG